MTSSNNHWLSLGISDAKLEEHAEQLSRDSPSFPGAMVMYFRTAASLLRSTRDDFTVLPLVFIQAVIGLEKLLRIYFGDLATKRKLSEMLDLVVKKGVVTDAAFSNPGGLSQLSYGRFESDLESHAQRLAILIPRLRNDLLHGEYLLSHEFLHLTMQVREMVDAIVPLLTAKNVSAARDAVLSNSLTAQAESLSDQGKAQ